METLKPNTIKDRGLGQIIQSQRMLNTIWFDYEPMKKIRFEMYQYNKAALDTVVWFMYGEKPFLC